MTNRIYGTSTASQCDCCGKSNLQLTIAVETVVDGTVVCTRKLGVACAKKAVLHPTDKRWMHRFDGKMISSREGIVPAAKWCDRLRRMTGGK